VYRIVTHLPESPPDIETHDVQPEEAGKKCEEGDESCKEKHTFLVKPLHLQLT
jgi:hypothetical protein